MNVILPMPIRLTMVFVLGVFLGAAVNWATYWLAWNRRAISPWSPADPSAPPRLFADRLPIVGWFGLRRETAVYGSGFWIRPMLIEILTGAGLAWLYWWEIGEMGLFPLADIAPNVPSQLLLHLEFLSHAILITLMLAASMIDIDEKTIPDEITVVGTLIGLALAALLPNSLLPDFVHNLKLRWPGDILTLTCPNDWPGMLDGKPNAASLVLGLACWWAWCFAILPRSWYSRHGWRRAMQLCCARLRRMPSTRRILGMGVLGSLGIALTWGCPASHWRALLTALVGMAASGGLVWAVRVVGTVVLHREAMGFGDVTLMAMIGAFVGWQAGLIIFFLAPFAGLVIGVLRLILFRDREIPYGPFLCLAALVVIVEWPYLWIQTAPTFFLGWIVPLALVVCLVLMAVMLGTWRMILNALR